MNQSIGVVLIICLVAFGIFRRVRRTIGWQQLRPGSLKFRTILFCVIGVLFIIGTVAHPISLISDLVGIILGALLAYYGARVTQFEQREGGLQYRPNTYIGGVVIALFFARLAYRFYEGYTVAQTHGGAVQVGQPANGNIQAIAYTTGSSWASGLLLIMFSYYVVYNLILLRKQKQLATPSNR